MILDNVKILQALLFRKPAGLKYSECIEYLGTENKELPHIIARLKESLSTTAWDCIDSGSSLQMVVRPEYAEVIDNKEVQDRTSELTRAQLETTTIILYAGGVTKAEIDFIRGVNSQSILRTLTVRGLIERINKKGLGYVYVPTVEFLRYIGVVDIPQQEGVKELHGVLKRFREQGEEIIENYEDE